MPRFSPPEAGSEPVLRVEGLEVHYGQLRAVERIDFTVAAGEVFGLIGPDGAGKTSSFHVLAGVMEASAGLVRVLGRPPRQARSRIGYLTQQFSLYPDLSVAENLRYVAGLRRVPQAAFQQRRDTLLRRLDLAPFATRLAGRLSGGMKQKLALCCALIDTPELLLLDEPTTGVDPVSRREFWDVLASLAAEGVTIVVATPYLDEAERCGRIAMLQQGRIRRRGTPAELKRGLGLVRLELRCTRLAEAERLLEQSMAGADVQTFGDRLDVLVADAQAGRAAVETLFREHDLPLEGLGVGPPTLENVFVSHLRQEVTQPPALPYPQASRRRRQVGEAITARRLSRRFGTFEAVRNLDLRVGYGEIFGLLGANGAGKTTTIKMLCGLLPPSSGEVMLAGERGDLRRGELLQRIGYMSQKFTLYDDLSILQNLEFYAGVYEVPPALRAERIAWVLATCGLEGQGHLLTGQLPGGWKQRLAFGASVLHDPHVLFLDEPTSGVDPLARRQFWRLINAFARRGTAILVTTHYLEEAEQCQRLCFLVAGENVIEGSPGQIKAAQPGQLLELQLAAGVQQDATELLRQHFEPWRVSRFADRLHLVLEHEDPGTVRRLLESAGIAVQGLRAIPFSLEDAFIGTVERARAGVSP